MKKMKETESRGADDDEMHREVELQVQGDTWLNERFLHKYMYHEGGV